MAEKWFPTSDLEEGQRERLSMNDKPEPLLHNSPGVLSHQEVFLQTLTPQTPSSIGSQRIKWLADESFGRKSVAQGMMDQK